jgi:CheY-like chemotaxis protein
LSRERLLDLDAMQRLHRVSMRFFDEDELDLLVVARFDAGRFAIERKATPAADLVDEAARAHRGAIDARGLELRCAAAAELPPVWADRERVAQVFANLVSNALKFTSAGAFTLGARSSGGDVVFSVADTGVGIAAQNLPRMFDPFWQTLPNRQEGVGLGLSIVKAIVDAHDGLTWARSDVGVGSTFLFTLPMALPPETAGSAPADGATAAATPVVLIVDDDADLRRALARILRQHGYVPTTAANGQEALDYLRRGERPALIVLDLAMPVLDGWAFLNERNRDDDFRSIPVVRDVRATRSNDARGRAERDIARETNLTRRTGRGATNRDLTHTALGPVSAPRRPLAARA